MKNDRCSAAELVILRERIARGRGYLKSLAGEAIGVWVSIMRDATATATDRSTAAGHLMDTIKGAEGVYRVVTHRGRKLSNQNNSESSK